MNIESYGLTHPGAVRPSNEDRILVDTDLGLYLICDGMGGHQRGEVAAELAIAAIRHYIDSSRDPVDVTWPFGYNLKMSVNANRLLTAIRLANRQIWHKAELELESAGMGTTVAAILAGTGAVTLANVGDSRIYRLRLGVMEQISVDDTMVNAMLSTGVISPDDAPAHPMRNLLTQAAGSQETIEVHLRDEALGPGDIWMLCSDGLTGMVDEGFISSVLQSGANLEECGKRLLDAALGGRASDNVSILLLRPA